MTASNATARVVFLDVARFLAIGLMTFAHVVDSLLLPAEWKTGFGAAYALTRGSTAPLFLLVGGWAFAVASRPHLDAYRRPGPKLFSRLSRVLTLCMWGWVLTMPWWHPLFPHEAPEDTWVAFTGLSALHCVGLSLLVAQGLVLATRTPQQLERALFAAAVGFVALAPFVFRAAGALPWMVQGPFRATAYPAGFPLFPWSGFFFLGAGLGLWSARRGWSPARLAALLAGLAALSLGVSLLTEGAVTEWLGDDYGFVAPSLVLRRLALASGVLAVVAFVTRRVRALPDAVLVPSRYSLTFYVAHMAVIWGTPWFIGLHHAVGATLTWLGCAAVSFVVLAGEWVAVRAAKAGDARVTRLARAAWARLRPVAAPVDAELAPALAGVESEAASPNA